MTERKPTAQQQSVIDCLDKDILLCASAGTGKTYTVAKRVAEILRRGLAEADQILCLTFTIKAAEEMKSDIRDMAGDASKDTEVRTIHSFAYQVLKSEYLLNGWPMPLVCDETDQEQLLRSLLIEMGMDENAAVLQTDQTVLYAFSSLMKHERDAADQYTANPEKDYEKVYLSLDRTMLESKLRYFDRRQRKEIIDPALCACLDRSAGKLMAAYDRALQNSSLLDFDDLICQCRRLFQDAGAAERWRSKYRFIIVDEMQDTSLLEYRTLSSLFPGRNVMFCGDFLQTIYQWRGSDPEKVLADFSENRHPERFVFTTNYRSARTLTEASFGYLKNACPALVQRFFAGQIESASDDEGAPIRHVTLDTVDDEAAFIYRFLEQKRPFDPTRICVMARSNSYIAGLYRSLRTYGNQHGLGNPLRFFTVDEDARFFRKAVIKDVLAFLRVLVNPSDAVSLSRITCSYVKNVGQKTLQKIERHQTLGLSLTSMIDPDTHAFGDPYFPLEEETGKDNIVIYATETTGLDLEKDQIIQISAIRLDREGRIMDTLDQMVLPTVSISEGAQRTHHQTLEDVIRKGGIPIREALLRFARFCRGCVLVGHNSIRFDGPLIRRQLHECGLPPLEIRREYDTMVIAKEFFPDSVNYKLDTLCGRFGIVNEDAHNALGDITATGKLLRALLRDCVLPKEAERRAFLKETAPRFLQLAQFFRELETEYLRKNRLSELCPRIIERLGLRKSKKYSRPTDQSALDDLTAAMKTVPDTDGTVFLLSMLQDASLSGSQMDMLIKKLGKIPVITVHHSKGCEFDTVILCGADDNTFPSFKSLNSGMLEEEKRVFYVAISRARKELILTNASMRITAGGYVWPLKPSRFIAMIPPQYLEEYNPRQAESLLQTSSVNPSLSMES